MSNGVSDGALSKLAGTLAVFTLAVLAVGLYLNVRIGTALIFFAFISLMFVVVGAVVAAFRQRNPIGWLFLTFGMVAAFVAFADGYALYGGGSLPGGAWVAWASAGAWHPAFGLFVFAFLLFPNGMLPSRRWRPVALFAGATYLAGAVLGLLWNPLFMEFFPRVEPPVKLPGYGGADLAFSIFLVSNFALLFLSMISLVLRLRRSSGVERQQLKWFVYAVAVFALVFPPSVAYFGDGRIIVFILPLIPLAAGVAILKHRLFDIDVVINKTLVYGSLTLLLGSLYSGCVGGLQYVFRVATGEESQIVVVASTLAIAAMFVPLRRRIQRLVDRRFYRERYDARKVMDEFALRLRDEVDISELGSDLVSVVNITIRPAYASLWLKPAVGEEKTRNTPGSTSP